jgi:hypothetical protein
MMEAETVSETSDTNRSLTQLIVREDIAAYNSRESCKL